MSSWVARMPPASCDGTGRSPRHWPSVPDVDRPILRSPTWRGSGRDPAGLGGPAASTTRGDPPGRGQPRARLPPGGRRGGVAVMTRRVLHVVTRCVAGAGGVAVRGAVALDPDRYESVLVTGTREGILLDRRASHGVEVVVVPELVSPISPHDDVAALRRILGRGARAPPRHRAHPQREGRRAGAAGRAHGPAWVSSCTRCTASRSTSSRAGRRTPAYISIERRLSRITDAYLAVGTGVAVEALRRGLARPEQLTRSDRPSRGDVVVDPTRGPGPGRSGHPRRRAGRRHRGAARLPEGTRGHAARHWPRMADAGRARLGR